MGDDEGRKRLLNSNVIYWIWLQQVFKYGSNKFKSIAELYDNIEEFYKLGENEWRLSGLFTNKDIENLGNTKLDSAKSILYNCKKIGCEAIGLDDKRFPELLKKIDDPPAVLYVFGDIECVKDKLCVAIVGTRKASSSGLSFAGSISKGLAQKDIVIISGGALGIDSMAHESAVEIGGKTVCVLGCGLDFNYLSIQNKLKNDIIKTGGAIISEYPPGTPGAKWTFPIRNRIISGLANGTVVIEAGEKSGSWITANLANKQKRDVYILPPTSEEFVASGSLKLINAGAKVVTSAEDILKNYSSKTQLRSKPAFYSVDVSKKFYEFNANEIFNIPMTSSVNKKSTKNHSDTSKLNKDERKVYEIISKGKTHIDDITEKMNLPSYKVLVILTRLEISGLIRSLQGKYYEVI